MKRRLAAILAADMVGYARLMSTDEAGTLARLKALRADLIDPKIAEHQGRIVKEIGDGLLVEFASVVDAVQCAVDAQQGLAEKNADQPEDRRIEFRMGINLGDIIVEGEDIYGDGVNIAARLESLAEPRGICIAGKVYDEVKGKLDLRYEDLGEQPVKNIAEPIRIYRVKIGGVEASLTASAEAILDRPAVAVLPFVNMSGDPEQEYFADGLTEDIITALSYWRSFPVIARNSTFTYKGQSVDVRKVATELGARYVLEGSVRRGGDRVRISTQLIDAMTGHHVWAAKFDRTLDDIFELQDEITQRIAAAVEPELSKAEGKRSAAKKPKSLDAWDYYQRGMSLLYEYTKEGLAQARGMFERAVELDPAYSQVFTGLATTHQLDILLEHTERREESIARLFETSRRAVALDDADWHAHVNLAMAYRWSRQQDMAVAEAERAVELNPNSPIACAALGNMLDFSGEPEEGIPNLKKGLQLNPRDPRLHFYMSVLARTYLNARRYEEAAEWARRAISRRPDHARAHAILAISLAHLGRTEEAKAALDECGRVNPGFAERWALLRQYKNPADNEHILDGLRKAGWEG